MNKLVVFIIITLFSGNILAQSITCKRAISNEQFQTKVRQLESQITDQEKLLIGKKILNKHCFSCAQIKEMASLFQDDFSRLEFSKQAYKKVVDKENFYDVYDAFIHYSVVFRLHDFVNSNTSISNNSNVNTSNKVSFPNYNYPSYKNYNGTLNCNNIASRSDFTQIASTLNSIQKEQEKIKIAKELIHGKCFSTTQLMKLASLLKSDNHKFNFTIEAYKVVSDIDNYTEIQQVFHNPRLKAEFLNFINSNNKHICQVSDEEFVQIIQKINLENFNSAKLTTAKHLIQQNDCYSNKQISSIISLFDYENSKLEIAIYSYKYSNDKNNYYSTISKALGFNSSKKKLMNYIKTQN